MKTQEIEKIVMDFLKEVDDIADAATISVYFEKDAGFWNILFSCKLKQHNRKVETYRAKLVLNEYQYSSKEWALKRFFASIKYEVLQLKGVQHAN